MHLCATSSTCHHCENTSAHLSVGDERNQDLTADSKELLLWHWRLGHLGFDRVQRLLAKPQSGSTKRGRCLQSKSKQVSSVTPLPKCAACQLAKAKQKSSGVLESRVRDGKDQLLKTDVLYPGQKISIDQYESSVRGRLPHTKGQEVAGHQYCGGTIFSNHARWVCPVSPSSIPSRN
jgi:hypothetical protein